MPPNSQNFDVTIVGAGVVGVTIGLELQKRGVRRVLIVEKEPELGRHSSGRNSGVLHAGIYYPPGTLRSRLCVDGAVALRKYLVDKGLPHLKCGKLILPPDDTMNSQVAMLRDRAAQNGVEIEQIGPDRIAELEPLARRADVALYWPNTWVFDPKITLKNFCADFERAGGVLHLEDRYLSYDPQSGTVKTEKSEFRTGLLINAAGLWADRVAHDLGAGHRYRIFPFRGTYCQLRPERAAQIRTLIYPVPDLKLPFLGVHVTRLISGAATLGPTAMPAAGRENYRGLQGLSVGESLRNSAVLAKMILQNKDRMRAHVVNELKMQTRSGLLAEVRKLVPSIEASDIRPIDKVGLRAQVVDVEKGELCMDFIIEEGEKAVHVINAISPAFSASLAFAAEVVDRTVFKK